MSTINPESLSQFVDFTGCSDETEAKKYILMYDNDVGRAADRYFQMQNRASSRPTANGSGSAGASSSSNGRGRSRDPVVIDDEDMEMDSEPSSSTANGRASNGPSSSCHRQQPTRSSSRNYAPPMASQPHALPEHENGVRRPMGRVRGTLVNESFAQTWHNGMSRAAPTVFSAAAHDHQLLAQQQEAMLRNAAANGTSRAAAEAARKNQTLQAMYRPPVDITFIGPWESARANATASKLWLLANLQGATCFASSCLNRDIWSQEMVREILQKNFFFWQVSDNIPDCKRVAAYYEIKSFPAVFIVDPRTGELVGRITQLKDAVCFLEQLTTFLDKYPDYEAYDNAFAEQFGHKKPEAAARADTPPPKKPKGKKRRAASPIEAASEGTPSQKRSRSGANPPVASAAATVDEEMPEINELCNNTTRVTTVDPDEWRNLIPPASSTTPQIQMMIRLPNNEREKISVPNTTPLRAIFTFIEGRGLNARDHIFVLTYPRREYTFEAHGNHTLASLGFNRQEMIHVDHK
uniref:UBX domain-containing protein n=1 Tax=Panagrellus redivivus TaxID=6233 RepID=A0A7E4VC36_PANRE